MARKQDIRAIKKKLKEVGRHKLFKYEQDYYWKNRRDKADELAQKYCRLKAFKDKKKVPCLTCTKMMKPSDANGCHWIEKGARGSNGQYWCRREEWNIWCCCEGCNAFEKERHHSMLTLHLTKLYGIERVEDKLQKSYQLGSKPKRYEIDEVIAYYKKKIKELTETEVQSPEYVEKLLSEI